jgi:NAD(P)-dependent dehydrogenase (short-subunit alcohol dehydrogenase family)
MGATLSQFFPPRPTLTEANIASQQGRVFIVTGGTSGIGFEICRILYQAGGKVYLAGRSEEQAMAAIKRIKETKVEPANLNGDLYFLYISLDDLATIGPAVEKFQASESRLDVLFNNAGVSNPPHGSVSVQGHELQMATNCLGPYLLTQFLLPTLLHTARNTSSATVRVIWTSSIAVELSAPKYGLDVAKLSTPSTNQQENYAVSKIGNWFLASQLASQAGNHGILSVTVNPGNLKSALTRHLPAIVPVLASPLLYEPVYGAYTQLWAGLSSELSIEDGGKYVVPWGRIHPSPSPGLVASLATEEDGGTGAAEAFVEWYDAQTVGFRA